jgi:hypothetical protein
MPVASTENLLVPSHAGANTPITVNNAQTALLQAFTSLSEAIPRIAEVAATKPAATQSIAIPDLVIDGRQSGALRITGAQLSLGIGNTQTLVADLTFDDFSDDGQLFIGGPVRFELSFSLLSGLNPLSDASDLFGDLRMAMSGQLGFSGAYNGILFLDVALALNDLGVAETTGVVTLNGQTIELSGL